MKDLLNITLIILLVSLFYSCKKNEDTFTKSIIANNNTNPVRYRDSVFASVDTTSFFNIFYRRAQNFNGTTDLKMDVYLPVGDTASSRAAIIFIHGGGFGVLGNRKGPGDKKICLDYAKRGYVTISISYRLGVNFILGQTQEQSEQKYYDAVYRAAQDARAALRFVKKNAISAKIDTNKIFIVGGSAGAGTAMNVVYLDQHELNGIDFSQWGPLDGTATYDHPGYSLKVKGVVNIAGAVADKNYIDIGDEPMINFYGTEDIYYKDDAIVIRNGFPAVSFDNGQKIKLHMDNLGISSPITLYQGKDHPGFLDNPALLKNALDISSNWMYGLMQ